MAVSAGLVALAQQRGIIASPEHAAWWLSPFMNVFLAFLVVATVNVVFLAPYRAWRMLNPFRIEVEAGVFPGTFPDVAFPRQSATLSVTNLAYRQRQGCVLHVVDIVGFDNQHSALPRFVCQFTAQPGETQRLEFLYWTAREELYGNDPNFFVSGPLAPVYGGNIVTLSASPQLIDLRLGIPDADPVEIPCRVWTEGDRLCAAATS